MAEPRYININDTAKIMRAELKAAFPTVKFSVRLQKYSMGCHITVRWVNGPKTSEVEAVTDRFYGTGWDGYDDSTTHHNSEYEGEIVHFAGSRPTCLRDISPGYEANCLAAWNALTESERAALLNRHDYPGWPENRPGRRLAYFLSVNPPPGTSRSTH